MIANISPIMAIIPLALTLCAICNSGDIVIPCLTCNRAQCEECLTKEDDIICICRGCRMDKELEMNKGEEEEEEEEKEKEDCMNPWMKPDAVVESEYVPGLPLVSVASVASVASAPPALKLHLGYMYHPRHQNAHPIEYMEKGVYRFEGMLYPTFQEWKHAEHILMSHIMFTSDSMGVVQPCMEQMYLVGQMIHRFVNHATLTTDYMLSYESDPVNPCQNIWVKYISTYYSKSPMPYDENIFYPYPLPLQFHL